MGHDVVILARQGDDNKKAQNLIDFPPVIRFVPPNLPKPLWSLWPVLEARALRDALLTVAGDYDAFVCHDAAYGLAFKHLEPKKPVIFRIAGAAKIHDCCVPPQQTNGGCSVSALKRRAWSRFMANENDWVDGYAWRRADALVVQSEFMQKDIAHFYRVPLDRIRVVPSGVDYSRFLAPANTSTCVREFIDESIQKRIITFCGRLVRMKNIPYLLQAFALMARRTDALLLIVGDGEERLELELEARRLGIGSEVKFVGHQERVEEFLAVSHIFVLPSLYEPFANALLEATAAGLTCLALKPDYRTIRTGCGEVIVDGVTGFLTDPEEPQSLATRLDYLVDNPERLKKIGADAQARCQRLYSWEKCAKQYLDTITSVQDAIRNR
jgi:glycosyltransferase involved in cell wall biosynthesis